MSDSMITKVLCFKSRLLVESISTAMIVDHMLPYMQIILQPFLPCMRAPFNKVGTLKTIKNE